MRPLFTAAMLSTLFFSSVTVASSGSMTLEAFFKRPLYAQPVATILGTGTNAGWYSSSAVEKEFRWGVSLPVALVFINDNDRHYNDSYVDPGCVECQSRAAVAPEVECGDCVDCVDFTAPTLFGTMRPPVLRRSIVDNEGNVISSSPETPLTTGVSEVAAFSMLPFATLQAMFSWNHTALTVRYLGIPEISGFSFQFPGIGLQHDCTRLLPPMPASLSVVGNVTFMNAAWKVSDVADADGTLELHGISNFIGVLAGTRLPYIEFFLEMGWEHSYLKPGGSITISGDPLVADKVIPGRNGFRAALNISLPVTYNPVVGAIAGAEFGTLLNIIGVKSKK